MEHVTFDFESNAWQHANDVVDHGCFSDNLLFCFWTQKTGISETIDQQKYSKMSSVPITQVCK